MKKIIRINDIKLPVDKADDVSVVEKAAKIIRVGSGRLHDFRIVKKALDARDKSNILYVFSAEAELRDMTDDKFKKLIAGDRRITEAKRESYSNPNRLVRMGSEIVAASNGVPAHGYDAGKRVVVVGCGPAGIFAALTLAESGLCPLVIERGKSVDDRIDDITGYLNGGALNTESNVLFGEGGAGAFSDGKLTTGIRDARISLVLNELVLAGADEETKYLSKPHIGTDRLCGILKNIRYKIISMGGEFRFETKLTDIFTENGALHGIRVENNRNSYDIDVNAVVLAIGHSARDTVEMLYNSGFKMEQKPFSVGVRIEHLRSNIDRAQYGNSVYADRLPAADYKLSTVTPDGRGVYTFCMCPGGFVIPAVNTPGELCVNGMSNHARDNVNSNSALLVSVNPEDYRKTEADTSYPLAGIDYQRKLELAAYRLGGGNGYAPVTLVSDFLEGRASISVGSVTPSYGPGVTLTDISLCFDRFIANALRFAIREMDKKLCGFADPDAVLTAIETRSSSSVKFLRRGDMQSSINGFFTAGEGGGHAGGIVSSAVDGIRAAESLCAFLTAM